MVLLGNFPARTRPVETIKKRSLKSSKIPASSFQLAPIFRAFSMEDMSPTNWISS